MHLNSIRHGNWLYLILAFLMAVILWYMINAREQIERLINVRLDYTGLPTNLTVLSGQVNSVQARLRGPREMFRTLEARDISYTVDLSQLKPGTQVVPFSQSASSAFRMYQVLEVIPPYLTLSVDILEEKEVPITLRTRQSEHLSDVTVRWLSVSPATVRLLGPVGELSKIHSLAIDTLPASLDEDSVRIMDVPVIVPQGLTANPSNVTAEYSISIKRRNLSLTRPLILTGKASNCTLRPDRVRLGVSVPDSLGENKDYLNKISVSVNSEDNLGQEATLPIQVDLPEGARLVNIAPGVAILQCIEAKKRN